MKKLKTTGINCTEQKNLSQLLTIRKILEFEKIPIFVENWNYMDESQNDWKNK